MIKNMAGRVRDLVPYVGCTGYEGRTRKCCTTRLDSLRLYNSFICCMLACKWAKRSRQAKLIKPQYLWLYVFLKCFRIPPASHSDLCVCVSLSEHICSLTNPETVCVIICTIVAKVLEEHIDYRPDVF